MKTAVRSMLSVSVFTEISWRCSVLAFLCLYPNSLCSNKRWFESLEPLLKLSAIPGYHPRVSGVRSFRRGCTFSTSHLQYRAVWSVLSGVWELCPPERKSMNLDSLLVRVLECFPVHTEGSFPLCLVTLCNSLQFLYVYHSPTLHFKRIRAHLLKMAVTRNVAFFARRARVFSPLRSSMLPSLVAWSGPRDKDLSSFSFILSLKNTTRWLGGSTGLRTSPNCSTNADGLFRHSVNAPAPPEFMRKGPAIPPSRGVLLGPCRQPGSHPWAICLDAVLIGESLRSVTEFWDISGLSSECKDALKSQVEGKRSHGAGGMPSIPSE